VVLRTEGTAHAEVVLKVSDAETALVIGSEKIDRAAVGVQHCRSAGLHFEDLPRGKRRQDDGEEEKNRECGSGAHTTGMG